MKTILIMVMLFVSFTAFAQFEDDILADKLLLQSKTALDNQKYDEAVEYLVKITRININPPPDFNFFYAYPFFKNNKLTEALNNVKLYLEITGKNGSNYQQALELWNNIKNPILTDLRDGKTYKVVKIGQQTWMAESLNYYTSNSWCYDYVSSYCDKYGRLYDWYAALSACPAGWHLPTDMEWTTLTDYLGGKDIAGEKLKATSCWESPNEGDLNSSGFSGLLGGDRFTDGSFGNQSSFGFWWSSTQGDPSYSWSRSLSYSKPNVDRFNNDKALGFSVRCLKD